ENTAAAPGRQPGGVRWGGPPALEMQNGLRLMGRDDLAAVLQRGLADVPGAARRAAAKRVDLHLELSAGRQRLAGPAVANERARACAFKIPDHRLLAGFLDLEQDERMWACALELFHGADEVNRMLLIEHREGVVSEHRTGETNDGPSRE